MSVAHVRHTHEAKKNTAWCGRPLTGMDWAFTSLDHAAYSVEQQTTVQPCKQCIAAAIRTLSPKAPK